VKRGAIVWVDLSDVSPPEMGKIRPAVVVSGTTHNEVLQSVVVVPTSSLPPEIWPLRLGLGTFAGKETFAVIPGLRQIRKSRIRGVIGQLGEDRLRALTECIEVYLK
jgi:mRNA-degrading endonuclease toxin of MazEF toxin-antitoxin module